MAESDQEAGWEYKLLDDLSKGVLPGNRPENISDGYFLDAQNVLFDVDKVISDTGYAPFADVMDGNPRLAIEFQKADGTSYLVAVTDKTVYKYSATFDQWQFISSDATVSTTTAAAPGVAGALSLTFTSVVGYAVGNRIGITLDTGAQHKAIIYNIAGAVVSFYPALPSGVAIGNAVIRGVTLAGDSTNAVEAVSVAFMDWLAFTNGIDTPKRFNGTDAVVIPNLPSAGNTICKTLGVIASYLVLGNTTEGGTRQPQRLRWCDTADATNWATGNAGSSDRRDAAHPIMALREAVGGLVVYRTRSALLMEETGSTPLFAYPTITTKTGVASTKGAVVLPGSGHAVFGEFSLYEFEAGVNLDFSGVGMKDIGAPIDSLLFGRMGEFARALRTATNMLYLDFEEETWGFYPRPSDTTYPSKAARYNGMLKNWTFRTFNDEVSGLGSYGISVSPSWIETAGTWLAHPYPWSSIRLSAEAPIMLIGFARDTGDSVTISNGGFDSDTVWTKGTGWAIAAGVATKTAGVASYLYQTLSSVARDLRYKVTFTVSGRTAGRVFPFVGNAATRNVGQPQSTNGTFSIDCIVSDNAAAYVGFYADAAFDGSIDNVSVTKMRGERFVQYDYASQTDAYNIDTTGDSISWSLVTQEFYKPGKHLRFNQMDFKAAGSSVEILWSRDGGSSWTSYGTVTLTSSPDVYRVTQQFVGERVRFKFQGTGPGFQLNWYGFDYLEESPH